MKGIVIDWNRICNAYHSGQMDALLLEIPKELWMSREKGSQTTLLHCAAESDSPNSMKRLLKHGFDPNVVDRSGDDAAYHAICYRRPQNMLLLICAGLDPSRSSHLYLAFIGYCDECAKVIITNGIWKRKCSNPKFLELRKAFVVFRSCIIAFIGIKRFRHQLHSVDRFLIREIALEMWAARTEVQ